MKKHQEDKAAGQILVESAIVMLMLFIVMMAIVEGGRLLQIHHTLVDAAREGTRLSVVPLAGSSTLPTVLAIETEIKRFLRAGAMDPDLATIVVDQGATYGASATQYSEITVSYPYDVISLAMFTDLEVTVRGKAAMRNETSP